MRSLLLQEKYSLMSKVALPFLILLCLFWSAAVFSKVYMTRDEALKLAFPGADRIEKKTVYLTEEQAKRIESLARTKLESKIYIFYTGEKEGVELGHAVIDTHTLRTMTETIMLVINPDGTLRQVEILAFFEPPDYMSPDPWINKFEDKKLDDSLRIGRDIPNMTGATITSNSMVNSVRRIMAVFQIAVKEDNRVTAEGQD